MSRKLLVAALFAIVALVVAVALNGDRLYGWLLALHGVPSQH